MIPNDAAFWLIDVETLGGLAALVAIVAVIGLPPLLLFRQVRRQGHDQIGIVKREAHKGMLRAMLLLYLGIFLTAGTLGAASGPNGGTYVVAWGPMLFGGLALLARAAKYFLHTKPRLDALAFVGAQPSPSLAWTPPHQKTGRGFWGWVRFVAISLIVLSIGAKVLYALSTTTAPQPSRVVGQATVPARARTPTPTVAPKNTPTPRPTADLTEDAVIASRKISAPTSTSTTTLPTPSGTFRLGENQAGDQVEDFDSALLAIYRSGTDETATRTYEDGKYTLSIHQPDTVAWDAFGKSTGGDVKLGAKVESTSGNGDIVLMITTSEGEPFWSIHVNPVLQQWSVSRYSVTRKSFFTWVDPRSFANLDLGQVRSVEIKIVNSKPTLLINGQDVVARTGVQLETIPVDVGFGFGGWGSGFTVIYDQVYVTRIE